MIVNSSPDVPSTLTTSELVSELLTCNFAVGTIVFIPTLPFAKMYIWLFPLLLNNIPVID